MAVRLGVQASVTGQAMVDRLNRSVRGMDAQAQIARRSFISLRGVLATAFVAAGVIRFASTLARANDTVLQIGNGLRAAGVAAEDLTQAQRTVFQLADETRSSLEATGGLYSRVLRSTRSLGISQQQGLDITRAFQQSLSLSGAAVSEATAASLQFGQALASGRLQGDELRSILENNSFFAQRFAAELGVGVGRLREMGAEGLLTSTTLADIALRIAPDINDRFAELTPTLGQAGNVIRNRVTTAFAALVGVVTDATGDVAVLARTFGDTLVRAISATTNVLRAFFENGEAVRILLVAIGSTIGVLLLPNIIALATAILVSLGGAILAIISPIGILVAAIAAIATVGFVAFDEIASAAQSFADLVLIQAQIVQTRFSILWRSIANFAIESFQSALNAVTGFLNSTIRLINEASAALNLDNFIQIEEIGGTTFDDLLHDTSELMTNLTNLNNMADQVGNALAGNFQRVGDAVVMAANSVVEFGGDIASAFGVGDATAPGVLPEQGIAGGIAAPTGIGLGGDEGNNPFTFSMDQINEIGTNFTDGVQGSIEEALNSGDFSNLGMNILTSFTESVNEQFAMNLSELLTGGFTDFFTGLNEMTEEGTESILGGFSGLFSSIGMLFSGGGGGGGLGGVLSAGLGLFGFADGGVIPGPEGAAMPVIAHGGEVVLNREQQQNLLNGGTSGPQTVSQNINVTGDVSEATRRAVREMGNEITNMVQQGFNERGVINA